MSNNTATMTVPYRKATKADAVVTNVRIGAAPVESKEPLLREALGESLRDIRTRCGLTLRELSEAAAISPGYLSELERGRKEVSSELLASVCSALGISVSDLMVEAAGAMALHAASPELAAM
nr:helix-turn-helix transcriptional regulator [Corynebacterium lactis]